MANEQNSDLTATVSALMESVGKIGQMQVEMVSTTLKTFADLIEPLGKTSGELAQNAVNTANQAVQNATSAFTQKK